MNFKIVYLVILLNLFLNGGFILASSEVNLSAYLSEYDSKNIIEKESFKIPVEGTFLKTISTKKFGKIDLNFNIKQTKDKKSGEGVWIEALITREKKEIGYLTAVLLTPIKAGTTIGVKLKLSDLEEYLLTLTF